MSILPQHSLVAPIPPQRPGEPECTFYIKTGECKFGPSCKFHHPLHRPDPSVKLNLAGLPRREGETICPFYLKTRICKYGVNCKFDHTSPRELDTARAQPPVKLTLAGFPRQEACNFVRHYAISDAFFDSKFPFSSCFSIFLTFSKWNGLRGEAVCPFYMKTRTC